MTAHELNRTDRSCEVTGGRDLYRRGDRIALEETSDPFTRLRPGDEGTVTRYDPTAEQLGVRWDSGSTLSMLLGKGDRVRLLAPAQDTGTAGGEPARVTGPGKAQETGAGSADPGTGRRGDYLLRLLQMARDEGATNDIIDVACDYGRSVTPPVTKAELRDALQRESTAPPPGNGPQDDWQPRYASWRHGGWYVTNIRYPSGACGCVSRNYPDRKWRIVCDPRPDAHRKHTYRTRDAAARAERELARERWDRIAGIAAVLAPVSGAGSAPNSSDAPCDTTVRSGKGIEIPAAADGAPSVVLDSSCAEAAAREQDKPAPDGARQRSGLPGGLPDPPQAGDGRLRTGEGQPEL